MCGSQPAAICRGLLIMDLSKTDSSGIKLRGLQTYNNQVGGLGGIGISGLNLSGAGQTVLNLTGKWALDLAYISPGTTNGTVTMELVIDGEAKFNGAIGPISQPMPLIGTLASATDSSPVSSPIICESSLTLKLTRSVTDTTGFFARAFAIN